MAEPVIRIIPLKPDNWEQRWENWTRWCKQKGLHQGRTGSVEGAYRSPQHWDPPEPRPKVIDVLDAIQVNRGYTQLALIAPKTAKVIQILVFHPYLRPQRQAQMLGTHYLKLDALLNRAKVMLRNQLRD